MKVEPITLSIIIVTWNGKQYAQECLDSLRNYQDDPTVEIIVVDNASSDGTSAMIKQEFPWVRPIENSTNLGFARANNIGMVASTGNYVCLVNSDVRVPPDCLHACMHIWRPILPSACSARRCSARTGRLEDLICAFLLFGEASAMRSPCVTSSETHKSSMELR